MHKLTTGAVAGAVFAAVMVGSSVLAQQTVRIRGPIESVEGSTLIVKAGETGVARVAGDVLLLKYKEGEKKIIVGPETVIRAYLVGSKDELKPGANVSITNATKKPDGSFEASRITVGRAGVVP